MIENSVEFAPENIQEKRVTGETGGGVMSNSISASSKGALSLYGTGLQIILALDVVHIVCTQFHYFLLILPVDESLWHDAYILKKPRTVPFSIMIMVMIHCD